MYPLNKKEAEIIPIITSQLSKIKKITPFQKKERIVEVCQNDWEEISFTIGEIFPSWKKVNTIDVYLVKYGTVAAFDYFTHKDGDKIVIWLRQTQPTLELIKSHFVHALVSAIVLSQTKISDRSDLWTAREFTIDFLLAHTKLAKIVKPTETISELRRKNLPKRVIQDSQNFKKEILKFYKSPSIKLNNETKSIKVNNHKITLTDLEWKLIKTLADKRGNFIKTFELAETVYGNKDNYFGWSLAKLVERVRKKIALTGITQPVILSARGMGYMLAK